VTEQSYEELRDSSTGEVGSAWKSADRQESDLRTYYRELIDDPRYSEAHKAQLAWQRHEETKERILTARARSKELLEERAGQYRTQAITVRPGEGLVTNSETKLLLSQNETG